MRGLKVHLLDRPAKSAGRFAPFGVSESDAYATFDRRAMLELKVTLSEEQLARIAERAAALAPDRQPPRSPWLNVVEAAEHLRCRKDRIYDLIALGRLQPRRDGRRVLLHRDDLDRYLEGEGRTTAGSASGPAGL